MTEPLAPQYDPRAIEGPLYQWWQEQGFYRASADAPGEPYVIQIPPPNVTAVLHAGHGLNNTIQDVLIRFERMRGRNVLWVPGTDHAGIATQNVVEKLLAKEGLTRFDIGREAFVTRVKAFVEETGGVILQQLHALGASADWSRTYFTLDPDLSAAVREVFVALHEKGLVYRGKYIINWCPRCLTALSNEEAEKEEVEGRIWHLRYPRDDGHGFVTVATTRPETMLGDTGVAVHPEDPRYRDLIGAHLMLPLTDRRIPVVADEAVDPAFGSGAVKVTPAHDPTDFEIGRRHGLESIDIMTDDAHLSDVVPERFRGLDRFVARKQVVAEFEALGLLEKVEPHHHAVGHCYRCRTVIEPRLSDQWFVKMLPLAAPALQAYRDGQVSFLPERQGDNYAMWMENIRDWCISRQLWWGHRIPVWYCDACTETIVSRTDVTACPDCGGAVRQDEDVLDTWFSSWLVPFSSLGWPDDTPDLRAFYPGAVLVTAPEILFFWVARMIMAGIEFRGEVPFRTVYLHGTVRDTLHRKMSKSLGNGIDPLEVIERYGADALRYTMVNGMAVGTDVILDPADLEVSFAPGRNFANKLWNIGRFLLGHLEQGAPPLSDIPDADLALADRWILARAAATVADATAEYERFRLNEATAVVYHFLWTDLADWYLEQVKPRLYGTQGGGDTARAVAAHVFDIALRLLHPVMPFITETLWQRLPPSPTRDAASISIASWPIAGGTRADPAALREFGAVQEIVTAVRVLRAEYDVAPGKLVHVTISDASDAAQRAIAAEAGTIQRLAKVEHLTVGAAPTEVGGTAVLDDGTTVTVPLGDLVDLERECARLGGEADKLEQLVAAQESKLGNASFVERAPTAIVDKEREKLAAWRGQATVLREKRRAMGCDT
ncbi:MAG: valine--tRNA ligase [Gemmatimonadales bacterium]|nr:valine--tRNA ligase [Gemmatimonadales bacterium]